MDSVWLHPRGRTHICMCVCVCVYVCVCVCVYSSLYDSINMYKTTFAVAARPGVGGLPSACTIKHFGPVIYGKCTDFVVIYCLVYCRSQAVSF